MSAIFNMEDVVETRTHTGSSQALAVNKLLGSEGWYLIEASLNPYGEPVWLLGRIASLFEEKTE